MKIFSELGWLYRYESRSANLHRVRLWRTPDLLVWNSADKTRKTKWCIKYFLQLSLSKDQDHDIIRHPVLILNTGYVLNVCQNNGSLLDVCSVYCTA